MKKLLILLTSFVVLSGVIMGLASMADGGGFLTETENDKSTCNLKIGDYFTLGKYNNKPIIWRYVADDEHGKLMVSDRILCFKPFGENNFWEESYLRKWLNSSISADEANWEFEHLSTYTSEDVSMYTNEKGFLHESNFPYTERNVMETVTQRTMLPSNHLSLETNGNSEPYRYLKEYKPGSPRDGGYLVHYKISELPDAYSGAAYEVTDTVFLMDELQVNHMWEAFGDAKALRTDNCSIPSNYLQLYGEYSTYLLRTPTEWGNCTAILGNGQYQGDDCVFPRGVRPAFYIDADNAVILSGNGTADKPYDIDGKYIGEVVCTDILARINGSLIPSYNIKGYTVISAEDLAGYGFNVVYDNNNRTLSINRKKDKEFSPINRNDNRFQEKGEIGSKLYNIYRTNIKVYLDGEKVNAFNIDGRTLVYIDALKKYGEVIWDENGRMISVYYGDK